MCTLCYFFTFLQIYRSWGKEKRPILATPASVDSVVLLNSGVFSWESPLPAWWRTNLDRGWRLTLGIGIHRVPGLDGWKHPEEVYRKMSKKVTSRHEMMQTKCAFSLSLTLSFLLSQNQFGRNQRPRSSEQAELGGLGMASTKGTWRAGAWPDFGPFGLAEFCLHARPLTFSALKCSMQGLYSIGIKRLSKLSCVFWTVFCVCFAFVLCFWTGQKFRVCRPSQWPRVNRLE